MSSHLTQGDSSRTRRAKRNTTKKLQCQVNGVKRKNTSKTEEIINYTITPVQVKGAVIK